MRRILGLTQSAYDPASRVRFIQFIPYLERSGWSVNHCPNRPDRQWSSPLRSRVARGLHYRAGRILMKWNRWRDLSSAGSADVVFVNRDLAGAGTFFEQRLLKNNPRVVFDFDDAIFVGRNAPAVRWMCERAAWITPGNEYLAQYARKFNSRVTVIPTVIDTDKYLVREYRDGEPANPVRVGWSGSDLSIRTTLFPFLELLSELQKRVPFELVIISNSRPDLPVTDLRWTFDPWQPENEALLASRMDIGIMPLMDNEFQRGKCGLKLLQYMAAGLPTVASPVGVNAEITVPGETGFLAFDSAQWDESLGTLVRDAEMRSRLGQAGRRRCEQHYSIRSWLPSLLGLFEKVGDARRDRLNAPIDSSDGAAAATAARCAGETIAASTGRSGALAESSPEAGVVTRTEIGTRMIDRTGTEDSVPRLGCAVAICTYKRADSLKRFLNSLLLQDRRPDELVIVDASPDDATEQMIRQFASPNRLADRVLYFRVTDPLRGLTKQRNFALRWVTVDIVVFFDDDIVLLPGCLREMESPFRLPDKAIVGVGACIVNERRSPHLRWRLRRLFGLIPSLQPGKYCRCGFCVPWAFLPATNSIVEGSYLLGGAMMWPTALARTTGFYDGFSGYSSGEDIEFSLRMSSHGKLVLAGAAHVQHLHDPSGRPDSYKLGYMSTANSYSIHSRCLSGRTWKDAAMFFYAYSVDTMMRIAHLPAPGNVRERWQFLRGRCHFFRDLILRRVT